LRAPPELTVGGAACALVLALAACGGGGSSTLSKQQYASKLSRLCLVAADRLRELHPDETVPAWRADGQRVVAIERSFNHKRAALKPPGSIQTAVAGYAKANDRGLRDTESAVAAAKAGDQKKLRAALSRAAADDAATVPPAKKIGASGYDIATG
jgi:predicted secreted protein